MRILVAGLGNELLGDDGIGILAAQKMQKSLGDQAHVVGTSLSGLALLEIMLGYDRAIFIDAIHTARQPPGAIWAMDRSDLSAIIAPSPHYAGLPEMFALAEQLELDFPREVRIFAVETMNKNVIGEKPSESVMQAIPELTRLVRRQIRRWRVKEAAHA